MRWVRFILFLQAIATLVVGIIFLLQMIQTENQKAEQVELNDGDFLKIDELKNIGSKFSTGSYILFVASVVEIILILRLMI